jgi:hypothetical protein
VPLDVEGNTGGVLALGAVVGHGQERSAL